MSNSFNPLFISPLQSRIDQALTTHRWMAGVTHAEVLGSALFMENPRDIDIGVLVTDFQDFMEARMEEGWEACGDYSMSGTDWGSIRKGDINLIVMSDPARMEAFHLAMQVCKYLNLTDKKDRVAVCQIVRDKVDAWQVNIPSDLED
jgi:hypothetical protein